MPRNAGYLLNIPIDRKNLSDLQQELEQSFSQAEPQIIFACANPHSIVEAQHDQAFMAALNNATTVVADGVGVTMTAKTLGIPIGRRITGSDYFILAMGTLNKHSGKVFFFGSTEKVLQKVASRMQRKYPNLQLAGTMSPPFGTWSDQHNKDMLEKINKAQPDLLWVGMTAPKQEKWVEANKHELSVPVIGSIGAVFDFYAETYPRAPDWMCRLGLEWAFRFIKKPKRMWKRTIVSAPKFLMLSVWIHWIRRN